MPAFKVRAKVKGWYGGQIRNEGEEFILVDEKDATTGKVLQTAEASFAEYRVVSGGWMERVIPIKEVPQEVQIKNEVEEAQRKADAEARRLAEMNGAEATAAAHGAEVVATTKRGLPTSAPQGGNVPPQDVL